MADTHEPKNATIFIYTVIIVVSLLLVAGVLDLYFKAYNHAQFHAKVEKAPAPELTRLRDYEAKLLGKYAWADPQKKDAARIPIERAIELEARQPWRKNIRVSGEA